MVIWQYNIPVIVLEVGVKPTKQLKNLNENVTRLTLAPTSKPITGRYYFLPYFKSFRNWNCPPKCNNSGVIGFRIIASLLKHLVNFLFFITSGKNLYFILRILNTIICIKNNKLYFLTENH